MLRGLNLEFGSQEEAFALKAFFREQRIRYAETLCLVNAIIVARNGIIAAVAHAEPSASDALDKSLRSLRELLFPKDQGKVDRIAQKAQELLAKEMANGPLIAQAIRTEKKPRSSMKRR